MTAYARQAVVRTSSGWTVAANVVNPYANIVFPTPASGSGTITHIGIGTDASGAGNLLYAGALTPNLTITVGSPPTILTTSTITETGKAAYLSNGFLLLLFNATAFGSLMRDAASPLTDLYVSLHTADPSAGDQTTSEPTYT